MWIKSTLAAAGFAAAISFAGAAGANSTAININGTAPTVCLVTNIGSSTKTISLYTLGSQDVTTLLYNCNAADGFKRTITSAHQGKLVNGSYSVPYKISHTGNGISLASTSLATPAQTDVTSALDLAFPGRAGNLKLTMQGIAVMGGVYTDTLTVDVTAN